MQSQAARVETTANEYNTGRGRDKAEVKLDGYHTQSGRELRLSMKWTQTSLCKSEMNKGS